MPPNASPRFFSCSVPSPLYKLSQSSLNGRITVTPASPTKRRLSLERRRSVSCQCHSKNEHNVALDTGCYSMGATGLSDRFLFSGRVLIGGRAPVRTWSNPYGSVSGRARQIGMFPAPVRFGYNLSRFGPGPILWTRAAL